MALKAALTSQDQDKVGLAIQELLVLVNDFASNHDSMNNNMTQMDAPAKNDYNDSAASNSSSKAKKGSKKASKLKDKKPMSEWLKTALTSAGVFSDVEPFWRSQFHSVSLFSLPEKRGPFFVTGNTCNEWVNRWTKHLVKNCR